MRGAKRAEGPGFVGSGVISRPPIGAWAGEEAATESQHPGEPAKAIAKRTRSLSPDIFMDLIPGNVLP